MIVSEALIYIIKLMTFSLYLLTNLLRYRTNIIHFWYNFLMHDLRFAYLLIHTFVAKYIYSF